MTPPNPTRALVLGGGGVTGIGWEVGLLAGLLDEGIDLRTADTVIGTSAGSFVGTNFTSGTDWEALFADQARVADHEPAVRTDPAVYEGWAEAFRSGAGAPEAVGAGFGRVARKFGANVSPRTRQAVVRARLRTEQWPAAMRVAVTDADTGRLELLGPEARSKPPRQPVVPFPASGPPCTSARANGSTPAWSPRQTPSLRPATTALSSWPPCPRGTQASPAPRTTWPG